VSTSSFSSCINGIQFWQPGFSGGNACNALNLTSVNRPETRWKTWQIEILDRALLYEGPTLADRLCWENGVLPFSCLWFYFFILSVILLFLLHLALITSQPIFSISVGVACPMLCPVFFFIEYIHLFIYGHDVIILLTVERIAQISFQF
jgi:hypothetical protein